MSKSKGIRIKQKERAKEIKILREIGLSWRRIGIIVSMDKNNTRRVYLNEVFKHSKG